MSANRPDGHPRHISDERWREEMAAAIIEQASHLTVGEIEDLAAAWRAALDATLDATQVAALVAARGAAYGASRGAAQDVALDAARGAALGAARDAALDTATDTAHAAWNAVWDVVLGLLAKDLISVEDFRTLTGPWESVMGPIEVAA